MLGLVIYKGESGGSYEIPGPGFKPDLSPILYSCLYCDEEFSLALPYNSDDAYSSSSDDYDTVKSHSEGEICSRANITSKYNHQAAVPGEVLKSYNPRAFDPEFGDSTKIQDEEKLYYQPCSLCKRPFNHPDCKCSTTGG